MFLILTSNKFYDCAGISVVDLEHVKAGWEFELITNINISQQCSISRPRIYFRKKLHCSYLTGF